MNQIPSGVDLMNQISVGELKFKQSNVALEVKENVSIAMVEILTLGARVRPLKLNGKRIGWIRPLAYSERKLLDRMIENEEERILLDHNRYLVLMFHITVSHPLLRSLGSQDNFEVQY